jgi:hypothetical protein
LAFRAPLWPARLTATRVDPSGRRRTGRLYSKWEPTPADAGDRATGPFMIGRSLGSKPAGPTIKASGWSVPARQPVRVVAFIAAGLGSERRPVHPDPVDLRRRANAPIATTRPTNTPIPNGAQGAG